MANITHARAYANNEVGYLAWMIDQDSIPGCLGFNIVREYLDDAGAVVEARPLASYVAFEGQSNTGWEAENTTAVAGTEILLARSHVAQAARIGDAAPRQRPRALPHPRRRAGWTPGMEPVVVVPESHFDKVTHSQVVQQPIRACRSHWATSRRPS